MNQPSGSFVTKPIVLNNTGSTRQQTRAPRPFSFYIGFLNTADNWFLTWWRAILSEFLCGILTIMLLKFSQVIPQTNEKIWDADTYIVTMGCIVFCNVQSYGRLSGGYGNPAVSFAAYVAGRIDWRLVISFVIVETLGSCVGIVMFKYLIPSDQYVYYVCQDLAKIDAIELTLGEIYISMQIALFGCASWRPWRRSEDIPPPPKYPLPPPDLLLSIKFGMMSTAITYSCQWMLRRGGGANPCVAFAAAIINNCWKSHWAFWVGPVLGCCLGAALYRFILVPIPKGRRSSFIL